MLPEAKLSEPSHVAVVAPVAKPKTERVMQKASNRFFITSFEQTKIVLSARQQNTDFVQKAAATM